MSKIIYLSSGLPVSYHVMSFGKAGFTRKRAEIKEVKSFATLGMSVEYIMWETHFRNSSQVEAAPHGSTIYPYNVGPPNVISWFITPSNYGYNDHKP